MKLYFLLSLLTVSIINIIKCGAEETMTNMDNNDDNQQIQGRSHHNDDYPDSCIAFVAPIGRPEVRYLVDDNKLMDVFLNGCPRWEIRPIFGFGCDGECFSIKYVDNGKFLNGDFDILNFELSQRVHGDKELWFIESAGRNSKKIRFINRANDKLLCVGSLSVGNIEMESFDTGLCDWDINEMPIHQTPEPTKKPTPTPKPTKRPSGDFGKVCIGQQTFGINFGGFNFLNDGPSLILETKHIECDEWELRKEDFSDCGITDCHSIKLHGQYLSNKIGELSARRSRSELWQIITDKDKYLLSNLQTKQLLCSYNDNQLFFGTDGESTSCHWTFE
jgi:hypothetical protein